ncbi:PGF-CTERM sorting domain-containing protein, partial [Methanosarcina sp.]|uniref:DUF7507 domain-containing protein n=1 Tax=Methanosarcina sp. TaxID=2213 RepID=UPI002AB90CD7
GPCEFPALIIGKSASPATYSTVGQIITYTYNVTNYGNANITGPITVTDSILGTVNITAGDLIPGQSVTGTANYTITQADLDAGSITNAAYATGTFGNNTITSNTDNETVTAVQGPCEFPALIIGKSASPATYSTVGQIITYTYNVTNYGNANITGPITVTDSILGTVNITAGDLIPGQSVTGTANYTITQADLDAGSITNAAYATGTFGNNTITSNTDNETVTAVQGPCAFPVLIIGKSASPTTYSTVGQIITYTYTVTNSGNVNITGPITVTDSTLGTVNITAGDLIPGQSVTGTANYTITQADLDAGSITNAAYATGTFGNNTITSNTDNETVTAVQYPDYIIEKTVTDVAGNGPAGTVTKAGDAICYRITVTNTGNVHLTNVIVTDSLIECINGPAESLTSDGILEIRETWVYTGIYTATQADIDGNCEGDRFIENKATVGCDCEGDRFIENTATVDCDQLCPISDSVEVPIEEIPIHEKPEYCIYKSIIGVDQAGDCILNEPGDIIEYQIVVKNSGNTDLSGVSVSDPMITLTGPAGDDIDPGVLNPGEAWKFCGNYMVTEEDINSNVGGDGYINNTATVSCNELPGYIVNTATVSCNELPAETCSIEQPVAQKMDLCIYKSIIGVDNAGDCIINKPGDIIEYQVAVKNEGRVDLTGISVKDSLITLTGPAGDDIDPGVLNPGETWKFCGNYTVTRADITNNGGGDGFIDNTATVSCNELPDESSSVKQLIVLSSADSDSSSDSSSDTRSTQHGSGGTGSASVISKPSKNIEVNENTEEEAVTEIQIEPNTEDVGQNTGNTEVNVEKETKQEENANAPGFEVVYGITGLLAIYMCKRRQ